MKQLVIIIWILMALQSCNSDKDILVNINTQFGTIKLLLYDETPLHKKNFIELVKEGKYDSTQWHRVIKNLWFRGEMSTKKKGHRNLKRTAFLLKLSIISCILKVR